MTISEAPITMLYLDCQAGISGDMTVAALLDLGVPLDHVQSELDRLALPAGSFTISTHRTERRHFPALKFDVAVHDHHTHRHYADIDAMIAASSLSSPVKNRARDVFRRLAEAEAKVHGVPVEEVHFHEVGAVDSIVDIVATAICLEYLRVDQIHASALPLGSGFVETAHGRLPVPAPATAELVRGLPLHGECGAGERVTPTGAAIVAALAGGFGTQPPMILEKTGCGAGGKDFADCPNILRAFLGRSGETGASADEVVVLEANIDDSTPEVLGYTMERLFDAGALDVFFTSIQMKKNRPAVMLSLLCPPEQLDRLAEIVLTETSAIGVRHYRTARIVLERRIVERETGCGTVRFKEVFGRSGTLLRSTPEYEDCRRIARESGVPLQRVQQTIEEKLEPVAPLDEELAALLLASGMTLALAESCTGGMIAQRITRIAGSSAYFLEGAVTYSNGAKVRQLGVPEKTLVEFGAVSGEVATAMAAGIRAAAGSDLGLAVTGIAGPDGGSEEKPVGTVFIALAAPDGCRAQRFQFEGRRDEVRSLTTGAGLEWLKHYLLQRAVNRS